MRDIQVPGEVRLHYSRQHRHAVLVALAAPHDDVVRPEIHVLDAEAAALEEPELESYLTQRWQLMVQRKSAFVRSQFLRRDR